MCKSQVSALWFQSNVVEDTTYSKQKNLPDKHLLNLSHLMEMEYKQLEQHSWQILYIKLTIQRACGKS